MLLSALSPSSPSFILSTPSLHPSQTSSGGVSPPSCLSKPSSHPGPKTMRNGSHTGLSLGSSILPRALPSVPSSTISRGTFRSGHCSFSGSNSRHSASVPHYSPALPGSSYFFPFQGAQTTYYTVLRPVYANFCHRSGGGSSRSLSNDTVTAEGLRGRVATATSE